MSTARRAYDLLRGYVNHEWDRIRGVDDSHAERELNEATARPVAGEVSETVSTERTIKASTPEGKAYARQILGVTEAAEFADIRHAFEKLNRRSDPSNFPEGSPEAQHAAEINKRVQWAYAALTEEMDTTEKRFRSLGL